MVAENDQPSIPGRRLAERLRGLREREHLTQKQLGRLLRWLGRHCLSVGEPGLGSAASSAAACCLCPIVLLKAVVRQRPTPFA